MDAGDWRALFTLFMFVAFVAIFFWAWSSRRNVDFEEAANLPLEGDELINSEANTNTGNNISTIQEGASRQ